MYLSSSTLLLPASLVLLSSAQAFDNASAINSPPQKSGVVPNRWIVEFDGTANAAQLERRSVHEHVYSQLRARGVSYDISQTYDSDLFKGASLGLLNDADYATLAELSGVLAMYPVNYVPAPLPLHSSWGESVETGYRPEWNVPSAQSGSIAKRDRLYQFDERANNKTKPSSKTSSDTSPVPTTGLNNTALPKGQSPSSYSSLPMSGVDKVHAEGNTGRGIKIAIVDSGINYKNPALGGCFGPGCLVAGGYDYVGDAFDGENGLAPDNDPADCSGHGTFVSGIIGAQLPNQYNVSGVSPGATLYAYRVFSCSSATTDDIVAKAMQDAYMAGNDIINLSLGDSSDWTGSMLSVLASRIAAKGVTVSASSGNGGSYGAFYTDTPGTGVGVLSVGAVDNLNYPGQNATLSFRQEPLTYIQLDSFVQGTFPVISLSNGSANNMEGCPVPTDLSRFDLNNSILIVQRSTDATCGPYAQALNLRAAGVKSVLIINTQGSAYFLPGRYGLQYGVISYEDGQQILSQIASGHQPFLTFAEAPNAFPNALSGGLVSVGSGFGPTNDLYMKPQLVAPGNNVVSTAPTASGFGASGGTSYSSAFVSGVAALYLSANGGRNVSGLTADAIVRALEITSSSIPISRTDPGSLTSVAMQGSGLVQAYEAIHSELKLSVSELLLNDTTHFHRTQAFQVTNVGKEKRQYKLSHEPAGTFYSFDQGTTESTPLPAPQFSSAAQIKFTPQVINLKPGESTTISVKFTQPQGLDGGRLPVYSGLVRIDGQKGVKGVQVPYLGVATSMKSLQTLDSSDRYTGDYLPALIDSSGKVINSTMVGNSTGISLIYRLQTGTPLLSIDLIGADGSLPSNSTIGSSGLTGTASGNQTDRTYLLGNLFRGTYLPRNTNAPNGQGMNSFPFTGAWSNGTRVGSGRYRFLLRSLRITGDAGKDGDYDSWVSPVIVV